MASQVDNGKAFEYSIAITYYNLLHEKNLNVLLEKDNAYLNAQRSFNRFDSETQNRFMNAARATCDTMLVLEPGLVSQKNDDDALVIRLATDGEGQDGDVRDVIFSRRHWEIGFSAKNNHDAVKHSRLSGELDFGERWLGTPCSRSYFEAIADIFSWLHEKQPKKLRWAEISNDIQADIYYPVLMAFKNELLRIYSTNERIPELLLQYLIGRHAFYKIKKDDAYNLVVVKAFNLQNALNKKYNGVAPTAKVYRIHYPERIIELDFKHGSQSTLIMVLDNGWQISFRIHTAKSTVEASLKFDIQLIGNPPVLFSQYIFNTV